MLSLLPFPESNVLGENAAFPESDIPLIVVDPKAGFSFNLACGTAGLENCGGGGFRALCLFPP